MASITEQQFLEDVGKKAIQFLYRSLEEPFDRTIATIQTASGKGALNWHQTESKTRVANIFSALAEEIKNYTLVDGDFRSYCVVKLVKIIGKEYNSELFNAYLSQGYNVIPSSIISPIDSNYSDQVAQNTNFPTDTNTSDIVNPVPVTGDLVPDSLYRD
jgi:hypothetical protein